MWLIKGILYKNIEWWDKNDIFNHFVKNKYVYNGFVITNKLIKMHWYFELVLLVFSYALKIIRNT